MLEAASASHNNKLSGSGLLSLMSATAFKETIMPDTKESSLARIECCPVLERQPVCDRLDFRYRLPYPVRTGDRQTVRVDLIVHFRLERCSGPLVLGDPVYSTTLLPGEQVRLFSSDRHTRWSYDAESKLAYRHETTSEESFFTYGMARAVSDLTITEGGLASSSYDESWAEGGGGASVNLFGIIEIGGGGGGGSYDAHSASSFARFLSQHAQSASSSVAAGVRAKSSTAVGEVSTREHREGESSDHFESASRMFRNPNRCHAVTYLFYRVSKVQKLRFRLVAIQRVVSDPAAPVLSDQRPSVDVAGRISVLPEVVSASSPQRLAIEERARASALSRLNMTGGNVSLLARPLVGAAAPLGVDVRQAALAAVDKELAAAGVIDPKTGQVHDKLVAELSWEREEMLPTPGILVKGCLDDCATCEPALHREIELELERKRLENEKLKREIELLDQAQQYRCCPVGEAEDVDD